MSGAPPAGAAGAWVGLPAEVARADAAVPAFWRALGLPGLVDVHVHFLPPRVLAAVWAFFDEASRHYGVDWSITYRVGDDQRVALLRALGVRAFPALAYPHKPGMAEWLADLGDRVVLGSDFPNIPYPYATQLDALARLGLGDAWLRGVLWHNGVRLLGLDPATAGTVGPPG